MQLVFQGERTASGDTRYGDGGHVRVRLYEAQLDGHSAQVSHAMPNGILSGSPSDSLQLQPGDDFAVVQNGVKA